jgi:hypothetical protein
MDGADIARRVDALLPELGTRADEIAAARRLPRDPVDSLKATAVFRISMPEGWGRPAVPRPEQVHIIESLADADLELQGFVAAIVEYVDHQRHGGPLGDRHQAGDPGRERQRCSVGMPDTSVAV